MTRQALIGSTAVLLSMLLPGLVAAYSADGTRKSFAISRTNSPPVIDGRLEHSVLLEVFTPEGVGTMVLP